MCAFHDDVTYRLGLVSKCARQISASVGVVPLLAASSWGAVHNRVDAWPGCSSTEVFQIDIVCKGICLYVPLSSLVVRFLAATFFCPSTRFASCGKSAVSPLHYDAPWPCAPCADVCGHVPQAYFPPHHTLHSVHPAHTFLQLTVSIASHATQLCACIHKALFYLVWTFT